MPHINDKPINPWNNPINANEAFRPPLKQKAPPAIDKEVSKIVGREVRVNDPRLIKAVLNWKSAKGNPNGDKPDNYLQDSVKVKDLKSAFRNSN